VLSLKEREYIEAARSLDLGLFHLIFREMLPNMARELRRHPLHLRDDRAVYAQVGLIVLGLIPLFGRELGRDALFRAEPGRAVISATASGTS